MVKRAKHLFFAPLYVYQGRKVKRSTLRLPEPIGERCGQIDFKRDNNAQTTQRQQALRMMVVGDSAMAGVGSDTQQDALVGQLLLALPQKPSITAQFKTLIWSVNATTGHTSFDVLRRLYVLEKPPQPIDVMVINVGVNDTTKNVARAQWQQQLTQIIAIVQRKFGVHALIFLGLPPMADMPALPAPLNGFIGAKAQRLDQDLQDICAQHDGVYYLPVDFSKLATQNMNSAAIFARDGFHPSSLTYHHWAEQLAEKIAELLDKR